MTGRSRKIMGCLLLVSMLVAAPAMAQPVDWSGGVLGWLANAWESVAAVFGASSTEPAPEPEPTDPAPAPPTDDSTTTDCTDCNGNGEGGPTLDPDG